MYIYSFRPGYGSDKLLIEFVKGVNNDTFLTDLKAALSQIEMKIDSTEDLWMNDEVLFIVNSSEGEFILSKDIWDCAFIMSDENQKCLNRINEVLNNNELFVREEVDYSEYEMKL
ncbi:MAG: hypothetical protein CVV25_11460 [Ignavibacteriae bacterium HGW-Ignavibacteriae-4]|jgi:hypothetical protein|nr:MAG: hypothetical protein CVV25_11460 [Ignavibacteriae bacterium HGW-Ignavibacteriae-4]